MRIYKKVIVLVIMFALIVSMGCNRQPDKVSMNVDNLSPQELVETYYEGLAAKDFDTAKRCLSDDYKEFLSKTSETDFEVLKSLTNLNVSPAHQIKLYGRNHEEVQVVADFEARYKFSAGSVRSGHQTRFIYVAKATPDSPWRIISIGTGP